MFPADRYTGIEIEINQRHLAEIDRIKTVVLDAVRSALASEAE
jgi:hypothetical protein